MASEKMGQHQPFPRATLSNRVSGWWGSPFPSQVGVPLQILEDMGPDGSRAQYYPEEWLTFIQHFPGTKMNPQEVWRCGFREVK